MEEVRKSAGREHRECGGGEEKRREGAQRVWRRRLSEGKKHRESGGGEEKRREGVERVWRR